MMIKGYIDDLKNLCIEGLHADGSHHKQWYLEQILIKIGFDLDLIRSDTNWDDGIPP